MLEIIEKLRRVSQSLLFGFYSWMAFLVFSLELGQIGFQPLQFRDRFLISTVKIGPGRSQFFRGLGIGRLLTNMVVEASFAIGCRLSYLGTTRNPRCVYLGCGFDWVSGVLLVPIDVQLVGVLLLLRSKSTPTRAANK